MKSQIIEVTQTSAFNWGKMMVGQMEKREWARKSHLPMPERVIDANRDRPLLERRGWHEGMFMVFDLQVGVAVRMDKTAEYTYKEQLDAVYGVYVCPLMDPFLEWLWAQEWKHVQELPTFVELQTMEGAVLGHRRGMDG